MNLSLENFIELAKTYNVIPLYKELVADFDTPIGVYSKLNKKPSFLLESVLGGEKWGRYSFVGIDPKITITFHKNQIRTEENSKTQQFMHDKPFEFLRNFFRKYNAYLDPQLPRFFGGMVGYISYDIVKLYEKIPNLNKKSLNVPDIFLMIPEILLVFDNLKQSVRIVYNAFVEGDYKEVYERAKKRIESIIGSLKGPKRNRSINYFLIPSQKDIFIEKFTSNFPKEGFLQAVEKAKEYVVSGDVVQVVLSQRFETEKNCNSLDIYRALRIINPSPYMFYINTEDLQLIGSSPEILVRLEDEKITVRPIAGTRRRGKTDEEDLALEKELLTDEKEIAEHIMLVDLGRNDVGRVAEIGSVNVTELMAVERYSHVMHIVSNVEGKLKKGLDMFDVFLSCFPAGTVTGAPKVRAMQIIEELEPTQRGPYAGAVGYFGFNNNMDMCIGIRMLTVKGKKVYVQAGAGIVADSIPENEYQETLNKAMAMLKSVNFLEG